ncbi:MAG: anhydro-N-acetylmuramic acid kinase [Candidatus Delongbacteria bacterium]|nr:anhydro-N-acetylmuramic acid kinase [Candidatus Delongbacteria bacterium]
MTIGLMSGTSLDGLDMGLCEFRLNNKTWTYSIDSATTSRYDVAMHDALNQARFMSSDALTRLDKTYGKWIAGAINDFLSQHRIKHNDVDLIASHGHTVFHQPDKGITLQIGDGDAIAEHTGIPVVYDFRTADVKSGGQGAPLVPMGDVMLFRNYDQCLNLGGFSNITDKRCGIKAWDICPVNTILNDLAATCGSPYDYNGNMGRQGKVIQSCFDKLENLQFYHQPPPKSLGREWIDKYVKPIIEDALQNNTVEDVMRTWYEHVACRIADVLQGKVLVTGGGAHNPFLIDLIRQKSNAVIYIPEPEVVDYKEALIFAFLGLLRMRNENNILSVVTGALHDHSSGKIAIPFCMKLPSSIL